jgi:hypothetical protein
MFRRTFRRSNHAGAENPKSTAGEGSGSSDDDDKRRLPLRWAIIILASSLAAVAVAPFGGPPLAIGTWIAVAVGLHQVLA